MNTPVFLTIKAIPEITDTLNHRPDIADAVEIKVPLCNILFITRVTDQVEWDRETYSVVFIEELKVQYGSQYSEYFTIIPEGFLPSVQEFLQVK